LAHLSLLPFLFYFRRGTLSYPVVQISGSISKSISEILREVLSEYIGSPSKEHLEEIAGIGADEEVSGRDHDRWLYRKSL
jgi:divalent metal cation (Fe/Co/Zn/Cd) transporter